MSNQPLLVWQKGPQTVHSVWPRTQHFPEAALPCRSPPDLRWTDRLDYKPTVLLQGTCPALQSRQHSAPPTPHPSHIPVPPIFQPSCTVTSPCPLARSHLPVQSSLPAPPTPHSPAHTPTLYLYGLGNLNPLSDGHVTGVEEWLALQHRVEDPLVRTGRAAGGRTCLPCCPTSTALSS